MYKSRERPFLYPPVFRGGPVGTGGPTFANNRVELFRETHPEFNKFLNGIKRIIVRKDMKHLSNVLQFINGEAKMNWIWPKKSLLKFLVKLYNYDFSAGQAIGYMNKCYKAYQYLLNDELKLNSYYTIITKNSDWNSLFVDFISIYLLPKKNPKDIDESYFIYFEFGPFQNIDPESEYKIDTKIEIISDRDIYEDALTLFDRYMGGKYINKVYKFAVDKLLEKDIISGPIESSTNQGIKYYQISRSIYHIKNEDKEIQLYY